jgi:hypothetical protein
MKTWVKNLTDLTKYKNTLQVSIIEQFWLQVGQTYCRLPGLATAKFEIGSSPAIASWLQLFPGEQEPYKKSCITASR